MEGQNDEQRESADDDHQQKPRPHMLAPCLSRRELRLPKNGKGVAENGFDVLPIDSQNGDHRAQMQQHVEEHMSLLRRLHMKHVLQHRQMSGAGYGKKFRDALYDTQENGSPNRQKAHSSIMNCRRSGLWITKTCLST